MQRESDRLLGDVAVITGAASGIGRAVAQKLSNNGAQVACLDINADGLKETVQLVQDAGGQARAITLDLCHSDQVDGAMEQAYAHFGKITILVNCAGIAGFTPLQDCSNEEWDRVMSCNINSMFYTMRAAFPYLKKQGGSVVNLSSSTGVSGSKFAGSAYSTSKAAAIGLTKNAAGYWAQYGIRCNLLYPGLTVTPIAMQEDGKMHQEDEHIKATPLGRLAQPEDQANAVMFLVSKESSYMTGASIHVNGGKYIYGL